VSAVDKTRVKLGLPPLSQVGVVVRNMDKAVEYYSSTLGLGPFTVYEFVPDQCWLREKPVKVKLILGKAMLGDIELELVQPLEGKTIHQEFLDSRGEGLHHLAFNCRDYDKVFNRFVKAGIKPLFRAESYVETYKGHLKACYFDTDMNGGILVELLWKSWLANGGQTRLLRPPKSS